VPREGRGLAASSCPAVADAALGMRPQARLTMPEDPGRGGETGAGPGVAFAGVRAGPHAGVLPRGGVEDNAGPA
jgi:hypothetical protein